MFSGNGWTLRFLLLGAIALLLVMGAVGKRGLFDWRRMVARNHDLDRKIDSCLAGSAELERKIQLLRADAWEQERVVRHALGYVRSDETVIEFP